MPAVLPVPVPVPFDWEVPLVPVLAVATEPAVLAVPLLEVEPPEEPDPDDAGQEDKGAEPPPTTSLLISAAAWVASELGRGTNPSGSVEVEEEETDNSWVSISEMAVAWLVGCASLQTAA